MSIDPSPTGGESLSTDKQPVRPQRRKLPVITVAIAVLVAGGGGAYWASTAGKGNTSDAAGQGSASEKPPKLAIDGLATGAPGEGNGGEEGIAPGEPHGSGQVYKANKELPKGPGTASVFRAPSSVTRASVAELAKTFGVPGSPEKKDGRWLVGEDADKSGKGKPADGETLTVDDGKMTGNWTYQNGDSPAARCSKPLPTVPGGQTPVPPQDSPPIACPAMPDSGKGGDPVSEKKAKEAVAPALKTLNMTGAEVDASVTMGPLRMVSATPEIGGMPAKDWNSTFTVDDDGKVVRGHGSLGKLREGASYPVMTAEKTLEELNKHNGGRTNGTVEEPSRGDADGKASAPDSTTKSAKPGAKPAPSKPLKVTDAEFSLVTRYSLGRPVLVPSWVYKLELPGEEHNASVAHPAVEPEFLKPAKPSQPGGGPADDPTSAPDPSQGSGQGGEAGTAPIQAVNSYEADGRTVKLTFFGGVCGGYKASADESGKSVKVTVRPEKTDSKKVCVKMAKRQTVEVELDKALGDRKVVDAQDGEGVPRAK